LLCPNGLKLVHWFILMRKTVRMGNKAFGAVSLVVLCLLAEFGSRVLLHRYFEKPISWQTDPVYLRYGFNLDNENAEFAVFGGSTVCPDTLNFVFNNDSITTFFCNPCEGLGENCINLAAPALTIVDSWYLYSSIAESEELKQVFFLNGINDARSNNIPDKLFDADYRHIQFYDEAFILFNHPEIEFTVIPTLVHLVANKCIGKVYLPRQNLHNLTLEDQERFLAYGSEIKTVQVFDHYLKRIVSRAKEKKHQLLIGTLPYYQADGYSIDSFWAKDLGYVESIFPTELYGRPQDVVRSVEMHNELVRNLANSNSTVNLIDLDEQIPKDGKYFNDVCHLSSIGCSILQKKLKKVSFDTKNKTFAN